MAEPLAGRVALVTGATGGFGRAIADLLLAQGARVVAVGRRAERLSDLATRGGARVLPIVADLGAPGAAETIAAALVPPFRDVDILINNAGHDRGGNVAFHQSDPAAWDSVIEVNLLAAMRLTRLVLPGMVARGRGDIINLSSITARRTAAKLTAYSASKHAVHGFTETLRAECGPLGIRVVEIIPGAARTEFAAARFDGDAARAKAYYEGFADFIEAQDVANAVLYALQQPPGVTVAELMLLPTRGG